MLKDIKNSESKKKPHENEAFSFQQESSLQTLSLPMKTSTLANQVTDYYNYMSQSPDMLKRSIDEHIFMEDQQNKFGEVKEQQENVPPSPSYYSESPERQFQDHGNPELG